jgi:hypothetical protein
VSHRKPLTLEEEKQAMIDVGIPEAIAEMNAQALSLFAQGDSDWITWSAGAHRRTVRHGPRRVVRPKLRRLQWRQSWG